jgi:outer membrane receptor protein involved in Fe transport
MPHASWPMRIFLPFLVLVSSSADGPDVARAEPGFVVASAPAQHGAEPVTSGPVLLAHDAGHPETTESGNVVSDADVVEPLSAEEARLDTVLIEGRAEDLVGVARSGSEGAVGVEQLEKRPILRNGELLEVIPGLLATQHSGTGKANQYFLRGFNLDHGSDFSTRVDGIPVNLPTHAHGQGYLDLNFVIPELVRTVRFHKGPYYAETGDFASAGSAYVEMFDELERGLFEASAGMNGWGRLLLADSVEAGGGNLLYAGEANFYDGPWQLEEDLVKTNALLKWTRGDNHRGFEVFAQAYRADWDATDQIPLRAVKDTGPNHIDRLGFVDETDGGDTERYALSASGWRSGEHSHTRAQVYGVYYALDLFSNFTYYLDDPINGDQIHQHDRRGIFGGDLEHDWFGEIAGFDHETRVGLSLRHDTIPSVALRRSVKRRLLSTVREDDVNETSLGIWGESTITLVEKLRVIGGLRADGYRFDVDADFINPDTGLPANSGTETDGIVSPKFALVVGPWAKTEGYLNLGMGFHSNDARGTTISVDPSSCDTNNTPICHPASPVDPLVRSNGAELGVRTEVLPGLHSSLALWMLDLDSELVFVGDAGTTEAGPPSRRLGIEWANYYEPTEYLAFDFDLSWTDARLRETDDSQDEIPGAIPLVMSAGIMGDLPWDLYAALRLRYLGEFSMVESGDEKSGSTTLVNLRLGYEMPPPAGSEFRQGDWGAALDILNLFDSKDRDIAYYYESRLEDELTSSEGVHFHPVEPLTVRFSVTRRF